MPRHTKTIFSGLAPNMTRHDVVMACSFLFFPWMWTRIRSGEGRTSVEQWFRQTYAKKHVYALDSGRSALTLALEACALAEGDEVLVQAYTCMVVINAIRSTGATPVYVDIDDHYNMDPSDAEKKCTARTKVMIIQHTFGEMASMQSLGMLAKQRRLITIEDCAHALGAEYNQTQAGTLSDMSIFSFGSEKVISCARGGLLLINTDRFVSYVEDRYTNLSELNLFHTLQHLITYPLFFLGKLLYDMWIGKGILLLSKCCLFTSRIIYPGEKWGEKLSWFPARLPNSLAQIAYSQLTELQQSNIHRQNIAAVYTRLLNPHIERQKTNPEQIRVFLDYAIRIDTPRAAYEALKQQRIHLSIFWSGGVVIPEYKQKGLSQYIAGTCPQAEKVAAHAINLPTHRGICIQDAERIAQALNKYVTTH